MPTDLFCECLHLGRGQSSICKHANLKLSARKWIKYILINSTWEVMWLQSCSLPRSSRFFFNRARMLMMRSAIPLTSPSHCLLRFGSFKISEAIRAP